MNQNKAPLLLLALVLAANAEAACEDELLASPLWRHAGKIAQYEDQLHWERRAESWGADEDVPSHSQSLRAGYKRSVTYLQEHRPSQHTLRAYFRHVMERPYVYPDSNNDSARLDVLLGIRFESSERGVREKKHPGQAVWEGFPRAVLQTSHREAFDILGQLKLASNSTVYDLGAGYGRFVLSGAMGYEALRFKAVELTTARARVIERVARHLGIKNLETLNQNVLDVDFSDGDLFYLYNPFPPIMKDVSKRLCELAARKHIKIVLRQFSALEDCKVLKERKLLVDGHRIGYIYESK